MSPHALPINFPFLIGVYMAVNALPDVCLFVDGPDCVGFKTGYIQGSHDLCATLMAAGEPSRIHASVLDVTNIVKDRTQNIAAAIRTLENNEKITSVLYTSMPMATMTGIQYDVIIQGMAPPFSKPIFAIPPLSLSGDWLHGYSSALEALAQGLDIEGGNPSPNKVAIVGYFMDRLERDHQANIAELERILRAIGLDPVSVWLSGRPIRHLQAIKDAGIVISLPHGRNAARIIARRTGAKLIETGIPFGARPTREWIIQVSEAAGFTEKACAFIDAELAIAIPRISPIINKLFVGRSVFFCGDPFLFAPFFDFMKELGCRINGMAAMAKESHVPSLPKQIALDAVPCVFEPEPEELNKMFQQNGGASLVVASDTPADALDGGAMHFARVRLGYPNCGKHAFSDAPFLGFAGMLRFVEDMANSIIQKALHNGP